MVDDYEKRISSYIKNHLIPDLMASLSNETLVQYDAQHSSGVDGFMSAIYHISLSTITENGPRDRQLIVKFMKGDAEFREKSRSYTLFANEDFIYATVLPEFKKVLQDLKLPPLVQDWTPFCYLSKFGYLEGLSTSPTNREAVLMMTNLKPLGYILGPRLYLSRDHLLKMCKPIGQFHALSYAVRLRQPLLWDRLKNGIIPLPFIVESDPNDAKYNFYRVLYRVAFDRLYDFVDRQLNDGFLSRSNKADLKLIQNLGKLREKYFNEPTCLLEHLRTKIEDKEEDKMFGVILHGDYNRNNVLFKYKQKTQNQISPEVEDVKMIDFQELRYGSPAIDLSFFMYMNSTDELRQNMWEEMLREYHFNVHQTLSSILKAYPDCDMKLVEEELAHFSFENFNDHFSRFAFYGVMICIHFLPWMLCSESECAILSKLFDTDMHSEEFWKLSMSVGGDEVNFKILEIIRHANEMGYMDYI